MSWEDRKTTISFENETGSSGFEWKRLFFMVDHMSRPAQLQ